jgi:hypothetical protein
MSHAVAVYLGMLGLANGLIAWGGVALAGALRKSYAELLGPHGLPAITLAALRLPPVFAVLALVCLAVALVAWQSRTSMSRVVHATAAVVAVDIGVLVFELLGLVMPFFTLTWTLDGAR